MFGRKKAVQPIPAPSARPYLKPHGPLVIGQRYRVVKQFSDYDKGVHPVGEEWTFLGSNFVPYEDGMSFFVSPDGTREIHIRLQWRPEEQADILDDTGTYLVHCAPNPAFGI
jgi:hypothetical protein